jgi:hypothetical protein
MLAASIDSNLSLLFGEGNEPPHVDWIAEQLFRNNSGSAGGDAEWPVWHRAEDFGSCNKRDSFPGYNTSGESVGAIPADAVAP